MGNQEQRIAKAFDLLVKAIDASRSLPERVSAEDFMLMSLDLNDGCYAFKNCDTRNYVFLNATSGELIVPKTSHAFMRGEF